MSQNWWSGFENAKECVGDPQFDVAARWQFTPRDIAMVDGKWSAFHPAAFMPNPTFHHLAEAAWNNGYKSLVRIQPGEKSCFDKNWTARAKTPPDLAMLKAEQAGFTGGWGFARNGDLVAIDLDIEDEARIRSACGWFSHNVEGLPMLRIGRFPRMLVVFRAGHSAYGRALDPEIFHDSRQTVFFGRHPATGWPYFWLFGSPATRPIDTLPTITGEQLDRFTGLFSKGGISGCGNGRILQILDSLGFMLGNLTDYAKAMREASSRHDVCLGLAAHAYNAGFEIAAIDDKLRDAYLSHFATRSEIQQRNRDFNGIMVWVERKVPKGDKAPVEEIIGQADGIDWESLAMTNEQLAEFDKASKEAARMAKAVRQGKKGGA